MIASITENTVVSADISANLCLLTAASIPVIEAAVFLQIKNNRTNNNTKYTKSLINSIDGKYSKRKHSLAGFTQ